jgi:hypothetical protein
VAKVTWGDPPPGVKVYPTEKATWTRIEALQKHIGRRLLDVLAVKK